MENQTQQKLHISAEHEQSRIKLRLLRLPHAASSSISVYFLARGLTPEEVLGEVCQEEEGQHLFDDLSELEKQFALVECCVAYAAAMKSVVSKPGKQAGALDQRDRIRSALCRLNNVASLFGPKTRKVLHKLISDQERYIIELVEAGKPKTARWQVCVTWMYFCGYAVRAPIKYGLFGWITSWVKSHIS